jgi:uncharacterized protein (DUF1330 family)
MPKAYVLVDIDVIDPERYEEYKRLSTLAAQRYGGKFIVRGGEVSVLEGDWRPNRLVVLEFDDEAAARRWYESPEYREAILIRHEASTSSLILVPGA